MYQINFGMFWLQILSRNQRNILATEILFQTAPSPPSLYHSEMNCSIAWNWQAILNLLLRLVSEKHSCYYALCQVRKQEDVRVFLRNRVVYYHLTVIWATLAVWLNARESCVGVVFFPPQHVIKSTWQIQTLAECFHTNNKQDCLKQRC